MAVALGAIALLAASCASAATPLRIDLVSPSQLASPQAALLLVAGQGFRQGDTLTLAQPAVPSAGTRALDGSVWVNDQLLSAPLPADLARGSYDLAVTDPDGRQATRQNALQIGPVASATRAATTAPTATVTQTPRAKATLPPTETPTPARTERPRRTETPALPTQTAAPTRPTPITLPSRPPSSPAPSGTAGLVLDVSGHWQLIDTIQPGGQTVTFADVVLQQQGANVSGSSPNGLVAISGTLQGNTLRARFLAMDGTTGNFIWTFSADGTSFSGSFMTNGINSGDSAGVRISGAISPNPAPPQAALLSTKHGRSRGQAAHGRGGQGGD